MNLRQTARKKTKTNEKCKLNNLSKTSDNLFLQVSTTRHVHSVQELANVLVLHLTSLLNRGGALRHLVHTNNQQHETKTNKKRKPLTFSRSMPDTSIVSFSSERATEQP